jgi:hypothetical protein
VQGFQGNVGLQGPQGAAGTNGLQGVQGPQGFQGTQGVQGFQGVQGVQGFQGFQGFQGTTGPQGLAADFVESFLFAGTFNGTTNVDRFLNGPDGVALDAAPLIIPYAVSLVAISATSEQGAGVAVWNAQVYANNALKTNATLALNLVDSNFQLGYPTVADFAAGDELALYVDRVSGGIRKPRINAFFVRV